MNGGANRRTALAAAVGLLATALILAVPSLRFAYRSPAGHLVLETTVTLVGGLVALLLYGRYRRGGGLSDLLLVYAMALLSITALVFVTLPGLLGEDAGQTASSWAALVVRLVGAALLASASLVPIGRVHRVAHPGREVAGVALALAAIAVVVTWLASGSSHMVVVQVTPETSGQPVFDGHPLVYGVQAVNLLCYTAAALAFTRRAAQTDDDLLGWIGAAAALGAFARVAYLLFPSLYTEWLYAGDVLRLGMYLLLLVGCVREIRQYWRAQTVLAVAGERRRLARELHDGVVQELGFIRSQALRTPDSRDIASAADRALDEARRAIATLIAIPDAGLAAAVARASHEVGARYDVPVVLSLDESVSVQPDVGEALVRIVREAVSNAARHAQPQSIAVTLAPGCLQVEDEGQGFDISNPRVGGFGLTSMRERAQAVEADVCIRSTLGKGTRVRVSW